MYADAILDTYGKEYARKHLKQLAAITIPDKPEGKDETHAQKFQRFSGIMSSLDASAVLKLYRLSKELEPRLLENRPAVHNTAYVVPRMFADESSAALLGYSERMYHVERAIQDKPWDGGSFPLAADRYVVRQFPFHKGSNGTPTWCDAFVSPKGSFDKKRAEIKLFLKFALSPEGYEKLLEPRKYYPSAYLLPAYTEVAESKFCKEKMPLLSSYVEAIDDSFPVFESKVYRGLDNAGEALKVLLKNLE